MIHRVIHRLKTIEPYFSDVSSGRKTFELRKDDRKYSIGDVLVLDEWKPGSKRYTDSEPTVRLVDYVLRDAPEFGLKKGFVILGLDRFANDAVVRVILELAPPRGTTHGAR